jgi:AraC-like DNA-binding protein
MSDFYAPVHTLGGIDGFPRVLCVSEETRTTPAYRAFGRRRTDNPRLFFQFTLSGRGWCSDGHLEHALPPGVGFIAESHDPHLAYGYPDDGTEPWRFIFVDFVGEAAYTMVRELIRRFGPVCELPPGASIVERLIAFRPHHDLGCFLPASDGMRLVMDLLRAILEQKESGPETHPDRLLVKRAQHMIQSEIGARLSVGQLAVQLRVSREHLTRTFTRYLDMPPYQYILGCKMLAACGMLKSHTLSVKEVAVALGFDTAAHFARAFRRVVHTTPEQFRETGSIPGAIVGHEAKAHLTT